MKRSIDVSLKSNRKLSNCRHHSSQQVTKRDNDREVRDSIHNYRRYMHETVKNSPLKSVKHQSRKSSTRKMKISSTTSPISTMKSKDRHISTRTSRKADTKQALGKLDSIYKELMSIEDDCCATRADL